MSIRDFVHPELVAFLDTLPTFELRADTLPEIRRATSAQPPFGALPGGAEATREEIHVPGPEGAPPVRALIYRPARAEGGSLLPAVLHIHGGGFVIWGPEVNDLRNRFIAADIGCVVVSVDYRLAPEAPFPAPLEDAYAGLKWLHANARSLGVDASRIAVQGESAGGGLAAALALLARDRGEVPLVFQLLVYPMLDDRTGTAAEGAKAPRSGELVWTRANNRFGWQAMLGREPGGADVSPYCAPARATDLAGLPPAFVQVGSLDLFADEDVTYALRLLRAGVPTELHVHPGLFHGADVLPGTRIGEAFAREAHEALRRALSAKLP
ncbi:alpha/beta hydrolase [Sorangium sp. So ce1151]|uniref:alpha/beta hydrolase n=1 Tax=Sorangium sp. So ce1151 TaxID=3133332 RepID=UPI003F5EFC49